MKSVLNVLSRYFKTVPDRLRAKRGWIWLFFIFTTVLVALGLPRTKFDMTLESWFSEDDPIKMSLDAFKAEFGSDDGIFIVYQPRDGDVFSQSSLEAVQGIRNDLLSARDNQSIEQQNALNRIIKINTLVNAPILTVDNDALISSQLVGDQVPDSPEKLEEIKKQAIAQKNFPLLYFSKDGQYGGIFIETDFGAVPEASPESLSTDTTEEFPDDFGDDEISLEVDESAVQEGVKFKPTEMDEYLGLMEEINKILNKKEYRDHLKYYPVGNAPMMEYGMEIMAEMGPMYIGMILIMIVLLWLLFRSLSAVVWPIMVVVLSTAWTVGIAGWLGVTITTMLMLTVMLILAVGIADAIHILSGYLFFRNLEQTHEQALSSAFEKSALACLLTSLTTMMGMLALTITPIAHIKVFGYMSAAGVMLAYLFTIYFLPVMLDFWSPVDKKKQHSEKALGRPRRWFPDLSQFLQKLLDRVLPTVEKSPAFFTLFFMGLFAICLYGATQVKVDSNIIEQFKEGTTIRKIYEVVDQNMMGTQNMEIFLDLNHDDAFQDPFVLNTMASLQKDIETKYSHLVVRSSSLVDVVKDSYQTLNEGREEMYTIPQRQDVLSQTLFMFNNANPEDRRKLVSDNYSKSHISVQLYNTGSYEYLKVFNDMRMDINQAMILLKTRYPEAEVSITGGLALMMELSDYITWSQIKSLGLVIAVISIILVFVFGSYRAGLISIIPNLIPATLTFGILGLLGLPLDSDTMIIAPVIIGIAVDDTIHFITHYRAEVLLDGNIQRALRDTIKEVGQAITFTTLILGFGFGIMSFSNHMGMSNMGRFGTLAIFVALFCDLFLLPAMILIFKPKFQKRSKEKKSRDTQAVA